MSHVAETCNSGLEPELMSLVFDLISATVAEWDSEVISVIIQIISLINSIDLDSQPKPESELMSLVTQTISVFNSMDLDSQPKPLSQLISRISQLLSSHTESESDSDSDSEYNSLVGNAISLDPEPEFISLIHQIFSLVISMKTVYTELELISLCPQAEVILKKGKFHVKEIGKDAWGCFPINWKRYSFTGEEATHLFCGGCYGRNHKYNKAPVEIKNHLHPKHSLQLVVLVEDSEIRECYCCDEDLRDLFYYCSACDFAMNLACVEKPPVLAIDRLKWHEHTLALFPSLASFPCNLCALTHSSCPFYICPPCDFVVHQSCLSLPKVIRVSRHPHRISFTHCFGQGDFSCGVCRRKIDNDYGGYSCIKNGCSYAAHSKCATQSNVWDGVELEGEPDEIEEEDIEPFVKISDGIIHHFSHQHHLRLVENTKRDYDEDKLCQACIMPIFYGSFYSCMQCDFILHEACANFPRKIHNPIHPHLLTLVGGNDGVLDYENTCSACPWTCADGFVYACGKEGCDFELHVQCATIPDPFVHGSHKHPLFLTSKPKERRTCSVCKEPEKCPTNETFNCIECDFCLCFNCATLPQKVRYKHDDHMFTLSYGKRTSTTEYWCEICEGQINPKTRFYICDENCCVTLHLTCLLGMDLYMKPGSSWLYNNSKVTVLPNNHHMSRPICFFCEERCTHKIVFQCSGLIYCTTTCIHDISR